MARSLASAPEFIRSMRERKKVEMLFAHLKADLEARPAPPAWAYRSARRVLAGSDRAEPETDEQVADA